MRTPFLTWRWPLSYCVLWCLCLCAKRGQTLCLPPLIRAPALYGEGPTLPTSLNLIPSLRALSPYTVTSGVKSSTYEFQGDTTQSRAGSFPRTARGLSSGHRPITAKPCSVMEKKQRAGSEQGGRAPSWVVLSVKESLEFRGRVAGRSCGREVVTSWINSLSPGIAVGRSACVCGARRESIWGNSSSQFCMAGLLVLRECYVKHKRGCCVLACRLIYFFAAGGHLLIQKPTNAKQTFMYPVYFLK